MLGNFIIGTGSAAEKVETLSEPQGSLLANGVVDSTLPSGEPKVLRRR